MREGVSRNRAFLFLGVRTLWQSLLLILFPIAVALLVIIPLAMLTKSASVDIHVLTHGASFVLLEGWHEGREIELLHSISAKRVRLSINSLEVPAKELMTHDDRNKGVVKSQSVRLSSNNDPHSNPWAEFRTEGDDLLVNQVRLPTGSKVEVAKEDDTVRIRMVPKGLLKGEISLNGPVTLIANDYQVVAQENKELSRFQDQEKFQLTPTDSPLVFASKERVDLELHLNGREENLLGAFSDFLRVSGLNFPAGNGETAVPIAEGTVVFRNFQKPPIDLKSSFVAIPADDAVEIVTVSGRSGILDFSVSGNVGSLKTGRIPDPDHEELPNLLDWLYHNEQLGVVIGILAWISGTVIAAIKLLTEQKK